MYERNRIPALFYIFFSKKNIHIAYDPFGNVLCESSILSFKRKQILISSFPYYVPIHSFII